MKSAILAYIQEVAAECRDAVTGDNHSQSASAAATNEDEDDLYNFINVAPQHVVAGGPVTKELEEFLESKVMHKYSVAVWLSDGCSSICES